jgi:hypothetical protein
MKKLNLPPIDVFESKPPSILIIYPKFGSFCSKAQVISSENPETTVQDDAARSQSGILKSAGINKRIKLPIWIGLPATVSPETKNLVFEYPVQLPQRS